MNITNQTINIHSAVAVNIGDQGTQQITAAIRVLLRQIESSTASTEEKEEAKNRLQSLLAHPLVAALIGKAISLA
jgi:hypothetical protein